MNNSWLYRLIRGFLSPLVRTLWIRDISGLENIPLSGSAILASNHDSNLDSLMLMTVVKRQIFFLAGEKLFKKWWLGPILKATGQIFVDRNSPDKSEPIKLAQEVLKSGIYLVSILKAHVLRMDDCSSPKAVLLGWRCRLERQSSR